MSGRDYRSERWNRARRYTPSSRSPVRLSRLNAHKVVALFRVEKAERATRPSLPPSKRAEGRKARWHVATVMIEARKVMDLLPDGPPSRSSTCQPFNAALARYGTAREEHGRLQRRQPNSFHVFEGRRARCSVGCVSSKRSLRRPRGDARRGAGRDVTWIVNDYNTWSRPRRRPRCSYGDTATVPNERCAEVPELSRLICARRGTDPGDPFAWFWRHSRRQRHTTLRCERCRVCARAGRADHGPRRRSALIGSSATP